MLEYLGEFEAARRVETAVKNVIKEGKIVTPDIRKDTAYGTKEFGKEVARRVRG
ncbi:MAG TPA: isocitrate/isopropylmalate family dehydrogenase [bacterium]|nr:isocitrate/isopropylmalate family dehydrogenase [bacterium]